MKIVKLENGNVLLKEGDNVIKRFPEYAVLELSQEDEAVRLAYGHQNKHDIYASTITHTQIEPNAETVFSGDAQDLLNLLSTSFFFEVNEGGGAFYLENTLEHDFKIQRQLNTSNINANSLETQMIWVPGTSILTDISMDITTIASAGSRATVGIYSVNETGQGDSLIVQTPTEFLLDSATTQKIALSSPTTLSPGYYMVAYIRSGTGGTIRISNFTNPKIGLSGTVEYSRSTSALAYSSTLPATLPTQTYSTGVVPFIRFSLQ